MGGRLGIGFALFGFVIITFAWNGAASIDFAQGQIPYLLSGGAFGIGLVIVGAALLITESSRRDRQELAQRLDRLNESLSALRSSDVASGATTSSSPQTANGEVVAGRRSFHDPSCRLASASDAEAQMSREEALELGLDPCRICEP
jgi:hypothetical protein